MDNDPFPGKNLAENLPLIFQIYFFDGSQTAHFLGDVCHEHILGVNHTLLGGEGEV
jgi:hypothetical protein